MYLFLRWSDCTVSLINLHFEAMKRCFRYRNPLKRSVDTVGRSVSVSEARKVGTSPTFGENGSSRHSMACCLFWCSFCLFPVSIRSTPLGCRCSYNVNLLVNLHFVWPAQRCLLFTNRKSCYTTRNQVVKIYAMPGILPTTAYPQCASL